MCEGSVQCCGSRVMQGNVWRKGVCHELKYFEGDICIYIYIFS